MYREGAFDFLAAYIVPEKAWYILPAGEIVGKRSVSLATPTSRYEKYREAWELLREAVGEEARLETVSPGPVEERMMGAFDFVRRRWER